MQPRAGEARYADQPLFIRELVKSSSNEEKRARGFGLGSCPAHTLTTRLLGVVNQPRKELQLPAPLNFATAVELDRAEDLCIEFLTKLCHLLLGFTPMSDNHIGIPG